MKKQENEALDRIILARHGYFMTMADTIHRKLNAAFHPVELVVSDDSARHEGHAGHRPGGETHFIVKIVSDEFSGLSRVERQRRVYAVLSNELRMQVHALQLFTLAPDE